MTTDVKLLPLPRTLQHADDADLAAHVQDYARACVAHATAAKDAEIEALRGEVRDAYAAADSKAGWEWKKRAEAAETRAERLAEALRDIESRPWNGVRPIQIAARAALRDHDKEVGNG